MAVMATMATMAGNHRLMLKEAFETFALADERVQVQTKEGIVVKINTSILTNLLTTGVTNYEVSLIELVNAASELGITGFSLGGLEDTSDTSSVTTAGNQEANIMQEDILALSTENHQESLPENVSAKPDQIITNPEEDGRKRKVNGSQRAAPRLAAQTGAGAVGEQHHDEQWVGPPAKRQASEVLEHDGPKFPFWIQSY